MLLDTRANVAFNNDCKNHSEDIDVSLPADNLVSYTINNQYVLSKVTLHLTQSTDHYVVGKLMENQGLEAGFECSNKLDDNAKQCGYWLVMRRKDSHVVGMAPEFVVGAK